MRPPAVARGLKSLVDKLNPGMPLTTKESSRLLTALTSSFRKQLDEAHPHRAEEPSIARSGQSQKLAPGKGPASLHSSAAAADHHLSSVLTNPLFNPGGPATNAGPEGTGVNSSATDDVIRRSGVDAIASFKEAAAAEDLPMRTVQLCMTTFHDALWKLSDGMERRLLVQQHKPGQTIFGWLVRNERHLTRVLTDSRQFASRLVGYLLCEGREDVVWSWLAVDDLRTAGSAQDAGNQKPQVGQSQHWRGWLLSYMLDAQLRPPSRQGFNSSASADAAIDTFLKALRRSREARKSRTPVPLAKLSFRQPATVILHYLFYDHENHLFSKTTPRRYDEFTKAIDERVGDFSDNELRLAMCHLAHPTRPDASISLRLLDKITNPQTAEDEALLHSIALLDKMRRRDWCHLLLRCVTVVGTTLSEAESNLIYTKLMKLFPERSSLISQETRKRKSREEGDVRPIIPAAHDISKFSFG